MTKSTILKMSNAANAPALVEPIVQAIPLKDVARDVYQPRRESNPKEAELLLSLKEYGQRDPVTVALADAKDKAKTKAKYVIVGGGNTRHKLLEKLGAKEILVRIIPHPGIMKAMMMSLDENNARADMSFGDIANGVGLAYKIWQKLNPSKKKADFVRDVEGEVALAKSMLYLCIQTSECFDYQVPSFLTRSVAGQVASTVKRGRDALENLFGSADKARQIAPISRLKITATTDEDDVDSVYRFIVKDNKGFTQELHKLMLSLEELVDWKGHIDGTFTTERMADFVRCADDEFEYLDYDSKKDHKPEDIRKNIIEAFVESQEIALTQKARSAADGVKPAAKKANEYALLSCDFTAKSNDGLSDCHAGIAHSLSGTSKESITLYKKQLGACAAALPKLFTADKMPENFREAQEWLQAIASCYNGYRRDTGFWDKHMAAAMTNKASKNPHVSFVQSLFKAAVGRLPAKQEDTLTMFKLLCGGITLYRPTAMRDLWTAEGKFKIIIGKAGDKKTKYELMAGLFPIIAHKQLKWGIGVSSPADDEVLSAHTIHSKFAQARVPTKDKGRLNDPLDLHDDAKSAIMSFLNDESKASVRIGGANVKLSAIDDSGVLAKALKRSGGGASFDSRFGAWQGK